MNRRKGFTLIEVIAAIAIIGIGLISLLSLFPIGIGLNQRSSNQTRATMLCNSMMEEIKKAAASKTGPGANADAVGWDELTLDGDKWYNFGKYRDSGEREVFPDNGAYEVSVKITKEFDWAEGGVAKVVVTAYWPKATGAQISEAKEKQRSVKLVSFIRYSE